MHKYEITIGHLFPDLLNLYGDRGNILALKNRMLWRGHDAQVNEFEIHDSVDFSKLDIVFLGGGSDREQLLVCEKLLRVKDELKAYVENGGVVLAVCGGYQLLGNYYKLEEQTIKGLEILDIYTETGKSRLIGNVVLNTTFMGKETEVVGFENHGGRTYIKCHKPFGKVTYGFGNNGEDGYEGVVYKNVMGTYLHGPLLPKNPMLTDYILTKALEQKYNEKILLNSLDDTLEKEARTYIINRFE